MSEGIPGLPSPPPVPPQDAAVAVVIRRAGVGVEVLWVRREAELSFAGGFYAFPGGRGEREDAQVPVAAAIGPEATLRATAARELFEEVGILLADGAAALSAGTLAEMRRAILEGTAGFGQLLAKHRLSLRRTDFHEAGRWITPEFLPKRFDARLFLVEAPPGAEVERWPGEHREVSWVRPSDALARWEQGSALLHPPNLHVLRVLSAFTSIEDATVKMRHAPDCIDFIAQRIEFQRGICLVPLRTPTLPPATHTNCYVLGNGELLVVDPGSDEEEQLARLMMFLELRIAEGARPKAIFLTHHHRDHIGGAAELKRRLKLPLWCHRRTADRLNVTAERLLGEGDMLTLQGAPAMTFRVLHTPGHSQGHLSLVEKESRAALVGDMVAGVGTILIDPPEGDMSEYLYHLERLRQLPIGALYPAHGPVIPDGPAKLGEYLEHRRLRESRVLEAIGAQGASLEQIVASAYDDVSPFAAAIAVRSTEAILIKLTRDGKVKRNSLSLWERVREREP